MTYFSPAMPFRDTNLDKENSMKEKDVRLISRYLVPGERPVEVWRHHWLWWLRYSWIPIVVSFAATVLAFASDVLLLLAVTIVALLIAGLVTAHWRRRVVFLTNLRVGVVGGLFPKIEERDIAGIQDVQNIDVEKPGALAFFFGLTHYLLQTGHGRINLRTYPSGIDKAIWSVKSGNVPLSTPPPSQPPTGGSDPKIIVH